MDVLYFKPNGGQFPIPIFSSIFTFLMGVSSVVLVRGIVSICCKKDEEDEFTQVQCQINHIIEQYLEKFIHQFLSNYTYKYAHNTILL